MAKQTHILSLFWKKQSWMMTHQNFLMFSILTLFVLAISINSSSAFAQEYDFVAGIHSEITFEFRDGTETVDFPVFSTTSDIVENVGTTFQVEGVVGNTPLLHEALDESFVHRLSRLTAGSSFEYDYRFFDATVNVMQNDVILKTLEYRHCEIIDYGITTLSDDYESYMASNTGFAVVDRIDFQCGGVHIDSEKPKTYSRERTYSDSGTLPFALAENVRTILTFEFESGIERMESVIFTLTDGYDETGDGSASFQIITAVLPHALIDDAINTSSKVSGLAGSFNEDFDVFVEFVNSEEQLRGMDFHDCIVSGYDIVTLRDVEEGYTGKRGFATAEILDVDCSGLKPLIPTNETQSQSIFLESTPVTYNMGHGPNVSAIFDFESGTEEISFTEFYQGNLAARANPTVQLVKVLGGTPLLYDVADHTREIGAKSTGVSSLVELFNAKILLSYGDTVVRSFDYSKCRITDYIIKTEHDTEESFYKGFALTDEFYLECEGYHPSNPMYEQMDKVEKAKSLSSKEWQENQRSSWSEAFRAP